jgi:hypothetical protein
MEVFKPQPIKTKAYYHCTIHSDDDDELIIDVEIQEWEEDDELDEIDLPETCCDESDCNDCQTKEV